MNTFIPSFLVAFILAAFTYSASSFLPEGTIVKAIKTAYTAATK